MAQTIGTFSQPGPVEFESVSQVTATNSVTLGETRFWQGEEYIYVYNAGSLSGSPGQFMVLSANSGYSLTVCSVTMYDMPIGFVKHTTIPASSYGWLMTRGFVSVLGASNTSFAISDILVPASQGRMANLNQAVSVICATAYAPIGYALSAVATVGAGTGAVTNAYVRAYGT